MNVINCPGCQRTFDLGLSIKTHQRSCSGLHLVGRKQIKKRLDNAQRRHSAKLARIEGHTLDSIAEERRELRNSLDAVIPQQEAEIPNEPPQPRSSGEPGQPAQKIRLPKRYHDELPPPPAHIPINSPEPDMDEEEQIPASSTNVHSLETHTGSSYAYRTEPDSYGVIREYSQGIPSITPDEHYSIANVSESPYLALDPSENFQPRTASPLQSFCSAATSTTSTTQTPFAPFRNVSNFRIMSWFYSSSGVKSLSELNSLVKDVLLAPDFKTEDLVGFDAKKEHRIMDSYQEVSTNGLTFDDSWTKGLVKIPLPCDGIKQPEAEAPTFVVEVYYRKLLDVIKAALAEPSAERFHAFPFKAFWQPSLDEPEERIHSEGYTGDRWNGEYEKIHATNKQGPHCDLEAVLIALMIWSDATMLAQFGNAQLWPIYLYIGNQSKYSRAKPSSFAAHHVAYIPKVALLRVWYVLLMPSPHSLMTEFKNPIWRHLVERQPPQQCSPIFVASSHNQFGCY